MEVNLRKTVTKIEANPLLFKSNRQSSKLRVAAYCRVSTDEEEQLNSYESQIAYYTEAIAKNPSWTFAGVYADAPVIIGLKQSPTQMGAALVLFSLFTGIFETFR